MITIDETTKSVFVRESDGDMIEVDGNRFELNNGSIDLVNLPSLYDIVIYKKVEENHIPKPKPIETPIETPIEDEQINITPEA